MRIKPDAYGIRHPPVEPTVTWNCYVFDQANFELRQAVLTTPTNTLVVGDLVDDITWPGLIPGSLRERTFRPLPEGGPGVGKNSLAYCVEEDQVGGRADFKIWDGQTGQIYHMPHFGTSRKYHMPVPVGSEWLTVDFRINGGEPARLVSFPFNLSGPETTLVSTSPSVPARGFWSQFYFADGRMVCPMYGLDVSEPTTCYVFDANDPSFSVQSWEGSWDYTSRDFGGSGEPRGNGSWRLKAADPTLIFDSGAGSVCTEPMTGSFRETREWPESQNAGGRRNGETPTWSDFPDGSGRILVAGWEGNQAKVWITTRDGVPFEEVAVSGQVFFRVDAAWILR